MENIGIGAIFVATWGYDQTNADFFQVVGIGKKSIKVRHIESKTIETPGEMSGHAIPLKDHFDGPVKTKIVRWSDTFNTYDFNAGDSMGSAELWDGKPVAISWYA